eukprot:CAMPEP_0168351866 /NCGR_PEP_ID=MMETSP0213-20121227/22171_1 /TAXON_ID=151035 /ORGANISM="Euplotes harpa, Strain FSP1.4" /LENGTH=127 /DNA_ID=CAMNT_0008362889 /DNA_START=305 /DNA_END=685 /DNA_ORIENTATION=-
MNIAHDFINPFLTRHRNAKANRRKFDFPITRHEHRPVCITVDIKHRVDSLPCEEVVPRHDLCFIIEESEQIPGDSCALDHLDPVVLDNRGLPPSIHSPFELNRAGVEPWADFVVLVGYRESSEDVHD